MPKKQIRNGMMRHLPGLAPPPTAVAHLTYIKIPPGPPPKVVQKTVDDMGVKAASRSADNGSYIHHHVIANDRLFACYETPSAARLAVERILALPDGHAAFARTFTSEYEVCREAELTRTRDVRVRSEDGAGDVREADDPRSKETGSPVHTAKIEPRKPAKASEKGKLTVAQGDNTEGRKFELVAQVPGQVKISGPPRKRNPRRHRSNVEQLRLPGVPPSDELSKA